VEWGITGVNLRSTGIEWDYRKKRPYSGFENFSFEIPLGKNGDCYDRSLVRMEEMRQSLRIIQQCIHQMPQGPYKSNHPLAVPPMKEMTMQNIETLISHFLGVTWGPVIPAGEAMVPIEAAKGSNGYYLISDGSTSSYRSRIRTPSFPHMQMLPLISKGYTIPDLLSILGAMDFVLADLDR
jgi:NADH-quinone oxidoreductase subunit C/D